MSLGSESAGATPAVVADADETPKRATLAARVRAELIRLLFRQVPVALAASLICAGLVTYVVWDSAPRVALLAWIALMAASTIGRVWLWHRGQKSTDPGALSGPAHAVLIGGAALGGALWGAIAALVILAASSGWDILLMGFVSGGMAAGAMAGLSGHPPMFYVSMIPNLLPCAAAYFLRADEPYPIMGAMVLVFGAALAYFSRNVHRAMEKSVTLRFENLDLIQRLGHAREAADALVVERTQALSQANRDLEWRVRESARSEATLRESEERLRRVIQNMPVMMYALDGAGNIIVWNRECERVTGFDAEQIVGKADGFSHLFPDPVYREEMRRTIFAHEDFRDWEARVSCADGTAKTVSWFNISGSFPVPGWASWGMGVDVSDRARGRESLEQALARERELNELKSRFVAMASHEFRTPLTSIQASVDLLRRYSGRMSDEQKLENLRGISREIVTVTELLEDILTLGRADAGRTEFRPVALDLRTLCLDQIEKARLTAKPAHEFKFDWAGNCAAVFGDEQLVLHILSNMLSNAVKYSPDGGLITLTLRCGERDFRLSVSDQGIGIPAAGREHLFDAFHRFDNVGAISGTGLGLAIMKRAAERHGGTISVESEEEIGTTVTAVLPIVRPDEARRGEPAMRPSQ